MSGKSYQSLVKHDMLNLEVLLRSGIRDQAHMNMCTATYYMHT